MARAAGLVMFLILISRLLGLLREVAIAHVFGMTWQTDVFRNAFNLPDLMYFLLVAGGLNAAFIPVFSGYLARDEEQEAWQTASTFFTACIGLLVLFAVLGVIFAPYLTPLVGYGFAEEGRTLLIQLMRIMFGAVFFTALAGLGMGIHKSYKSFTAPMVGPIVYNLVIIMGTVLLARWIGIYAMAVGTVVGAIGNMLVQIPFFIKKGWRFFRLRLDIHNEGFRKILRLMGPSVIALSIFQVSFTISANLASGLAEGSASALRIGQQLVQLPLGIFAMGMGTVLLPTLSEYAAKREFDAFRRTFSLGLRTVLFITIPAAVGLAVAAQPIIRLLFETGEFSATNTQMAAVALRFYSIGLFAQAASQILMQVFFALHDTKTLVRVSIISILTNTGLALLLLTTTPWQHGALALAWSLTVILNMTVYLYSLKKHIGVLELRPLIQSVLRSVVASAVMAVLVHYVASLLEKRLDTTLFFGQLWQVACSVGIGAGVYALLAWLLRMDEIQYVLEMIYRRRQPAGIYKK